MPKIRRGAWSILVASEIERLTDELSTLPDRAAGLFDARRRVVEDHVKRADEAIKPVEVLQALHDWYSGAPIEMAWASLHRAGETLLMIQSPDALAAELPDIEQSLEANLKEDDPRRKKFDPALKRAEELLLTGTAGETEKQQKAEQHRDGGKRVPDELRAQLVAARRTANVASDTAHAMVRKWRNLLLLGGITVGLLAVAVAVVHAFAPEFLSLVPGDSKAKADAVEPWEVELVGMVGGAVAAVLALNRFSGFTDPYGLPSTQALLRIPMSAVTSLLGVVLMQTSALGALMPQSGTKILAFAFLFGYAQEPLLRLIDRQAGKVLDPARGKNEPDKKPGKEAGPSTTKGS